MFAQLLARLGLAGEENRPSSNNLNKLNEFIELAFTHRSFAYENGLAHTNERLEFLGEIGRAHV